MIGKVHIPAGVAAVVVATIYGPRTPVSSVILQGISKLGAPPRYKELINLRGILHYTMSFQAVRSPLFYEECHESPLT